MFYFHARNSWEPIVEYPSPKITRSLGFMLMVSAPESFAFEICN